MPKTRPTKTGRRHTYEAGVKESVFQARVIQCAKLNGWRFSVEDANADSPTAGLLGKFFRDLGVVAKKLLERAQGIFTLVYHTHDSRRSAPGFPDLVMIHPRRRQLLVVELKKEGQYPTFEQRLWLAAFSAVADAAPETVLVRIWKPSMWEEIVETLGGVDSRLFV